MPIKVTQYLEVVSSWCFWATPMWAELHSRYAGRVEFDWKIAPGGNSGVKYRIQDRVLLARISVGLPRQL